jgi:hypothetical protein
VPTQQGIFNRNDGTTILLERTPPAKGVLQVDGSEFAADFEQAAVSVSSACSLLRFSPQPQRRS